MPILRHVRQAASDAAHRAGSPGPRKLFDGAHAGMTVLMQVMQVRAFGPVAAAAAGRACWMKMYCRSCMHFHVAVVTFQQDTSTGALMGHVPVKYKNEH